MFGMDAWAYRAQHQEFSALFDEAMQSITQGVNSGLIAHYSFETMPWLIDVGGGNGALLIAILQQNSATRGTVFELPHVVGHARGQVATAGLSGHCDVIQGNALVSVTSGADGYLLKSVLHGRPDDQAATVLRNCRSAMPSHGKVIVIGRILPERIDPANERDRGNFIQDVGMMLTSGGKERTEGEFKSLFETAGLCLNQIVPTPGTSMIMEAVPV